MALLERTCPNGHRWRDLVGVVAGPELVDCPECGRRTVGNVPGVIVPDVCGIERLDPAEVSMGLEHRADVERNADKLRSGEVRINQSGRIPMELRPRIGRTLH